MPICSMKSNIMGVSDRVISYFLVDLAPAIPPSDAITMLQPKNSDKFSTTSIVIEE